MEWNITEIAEAELRLHPGVRDSIAREDKVIDGFPSLVIQNISGPDACVSGEVHQNPGADNP